MDGESGVYHRQAGTDKKIKEMRLIVKPHRVTETGYKGNTFTMKTLE